MYDSYDDMRHGPIDQYDAYEDFWEDHSLSRFHDVFGNPYEDADYYEEDYGRDDDMVDGGYEVGYH